MRFILSGMLAVFEVIVVYLALVWAPWYLIPMKLWQFDLLMIGVAVLAILLPRRSLEEYGLSFRNWKVQLRMAMTAYLPVSLSFLPTALIDSTSWMGAIILSAAILLALLVVAWLLNRKLLPIIGIVTVAATLIGFGLVSTMHGRLPSLSAFTGNFLTYAIFVGFGEEILWRGYIQSRLNQAFGKPFKFFGVSWGPGLILASVFFGFVHVLNGYPDQWYWAWGLWTACSGLMLGFVREKSGSILASSILHGLPFGLGRAFGM